MRKSRPFALVSEVDRKRIMDHIAMLSLGKPWQVTVGPLTKTRTLSQNSLMWKWLNEVADHVSEHTGYEANEVHEFLKRKFLQPKIIVINGEEIRHWTTTNLTTSEMSAYMEKIYRWATSELGIFLPTPEELHERAA